jgi:isocitrate dehydrogenase (NAD+)
MTRVTLIPGDGIGPEIVDAAALVLRATGVALEFEQAEAGAAAERRWGHPLPAETVASLRRNRVGLKGPLIVEKGSPAVRLDSGERFATPNAALRGVCGAFANVRPCRLFAGVPSRFGGERIDLIIVREVSEGIYVGRERPVSEEAAEATLVTTRQGSERIARFAFEWAQREGRAKVTAVHKANVLDLTDGLFLRSFHDVAEQFPRIEADDMMIDASAAEMVRRPSRFDMIVAPNQYGDILSDLAASVVGGLGLGPGGNYGAEVALFEACHGAAPDIAGQGKANPIALILSAAMMLDHLHEREAAEAIRQAVAGFLEAGEDLTPDVGGSGSTMSAAEAIARRVAG